MNELMPAQAHGHAPAHIAHSFGDIVQMAELVANSRMFPGIVTPQAAAALMLLCQSEGLHPMQALRRYHVIEGRPSMKADAMQAEFMRHGGSIRWVQTDGDVCEAVFSHPTHAPAGYTVRVTLDELYQSGVATAWNKEDGRMDLKKMYRQFPAQMLRARVISQGVRMVLPGVVAGIYTPEEVRDGIESDRSDSPRDITPPPADAAAKPAEADREKREPARPAAEKRREQQKAGALKPFPQWVAQGLKETSKKFRLEVLEKMGVTLPESFSLATLEGLTTALHDAASAERIVAECPAGTKASVLSGALTLAFPEHREKFRGWAGDYLRAAADRARRELEEEARERMEAADPDAATIEAEAELYDAPEGVGDAWEPPVETALG